MFGGREDFALCSSHIFLATSHYKDRLFTAHWSLDVSVRFGSQGFDLATCRNKKKKIKISFKCRPLDTKKRDQIA
jgi:hypothetical protein